MQRLFMVAGGIAVALLCGCSITQPVKYDLKDASKVSQGSAYSGYTVSVRELKEMRKPAAKEGAWNAPATVQRNNASWFYNSADHYSNGVVSPGVSEMLAKHLDASGLFKSACFNCDKTTGADLILDGKIVRFDGFKESSASAKAGTYFGVVGVLATAGVKSKYEATTVLSDLKLIKADTGAVLWQGAADGSIQGEDYADAAGWSVYAKANESLKKAVEGLIAKLRQGNPGKAVAELKSK